MEISFVCRDQLALLPHDLCPRGFYSGRAKSRLEGMTQT
jgi:hypothetical protein